MLGFTYAADLAQTKVVSYVITTGGWAAGDAQAEGSVGAAYLRKRGIAPGRVLVERESTFTEENLRVGRWLTRSAWGARGPSGA